MFEAVKHFFRSIYGAFIILVFFLGAFYPGLIGSQFLTLWIALFLIPVIYKLNQMDKEKGKALEMGEIQITSERQAKAIDDYVLMIKKKSRKQ